jgi:hypothetical protein
VRHGGKPNRALPELQSRITGGRTLDERGVLNAWRQLFNGKAVTPVSLRLAKALLEDVSGESPLQIRLALELEQIKKLQLERQESSNLGSSK